MCENLGKATRDVEGAVIGYEKSDYCIGHLEYLVLQLKRSKTVAVKLNRLNIATLHLIPMITCYGDNPTLVMAAACRKWELEDDWDFVQSVLLLCRNMLLLQEDTLDEDRFEDLDISKLDDKFLEKMFSENLIGEVMMVTTYLDTWRRTPRRYGVYDSTFYRIIKFAASFKRDGNSDSVLPLGKETMKAILMPFSAAAIVAIGTFNSTAAKLDGLKPVASDAPYAHWISFSRGALTYMPYVYVPIGLLGIVLSIAVSAEGRLIGLASGYMLLQLLYILLVGALCAFVKTAVTGWIVGLVAVLAMLLLVICWGTLCKYPEWLSSWVHDRVVATFAKLAALWKRTLLLALGSPRAAGSRVIPASDFELEGIQTEGSKGE